MPYGTSVCASTGQRDSCVLRKRLVIDIVPKLLQGWAHKITPVIDSIAVVHLSGQRNKREYNSEHDHDVQLREFAGESAAWQPDHAFAIFVP